MQQSRPSWQPGGFRCSDCGRSGPGFPVLAVRVPKRRGQIAPSVVFTTKYSGKPGAHRCRWSPDCTETRFAANGPVKTAPKRVFLPPGASGLHRNPPSRHWRRESGRSSGTGPRDIASPPLPSSAPRAPLTLSASSAPRAPEGVPARTPLVLAGVPPPRPPRPRPAPVAPARSDFFYFPQICTTWPSKAVFFWIKEGRQGDLRQRNAIDAGRPANVQR